MPKSVLRAVLGRMQFTLHATCQTPHGASLLVQAISAWLVKTRRAPSRHSRDARVYGHTTTAMHKLSTPSPPPRPAPSPPLPKKAGDSSRKKLREPMAPLPAVSERGSKPRSCELPPLSLKRAAEAATALASCRCWCSVASLLIVCWVGAGEDKGTHAKSKDVYDMSLSRPPAASAASSSSSRSSSRSMSSSSNNNC